MTKEKRILILEVNPDCRALRFNCATHSTTTTGCIAIKTGGMSVLRSKTAPNAKALLLPVLPAPKPWIKWLKHYVIDIVLKKFVLLVMNGKSTEQKKMPKLRWTRS